MDPFFQKLLDPGKCELKTKKEIRVQINDIRSYSFQLKGLRIHIHIWIRIWFTERKKRGIYLWNDASLLYGFDDQFVDPGGDGVHLTLGVQPFVS